MTLFKRVYLIDSPGTVPGGTRDTPSQLVLKVTSPPLFVFLLFFPLLPQGVTRVSALEDPAEHVAAVLARARPEHVARTYGLREWASPLDFLEQLARRQGRLLRGGFPDVATAARGVLVDWQSGRLPFFEPPPMEGEARAPREQPLDELRVDPALEHEPEELYRGRAAGEVAEEGLELEQLAHLNDKGKEEEEEDQEEGGEEDEDEDEEEELDFDELV